MIALAIAAGYGIMYVPETLAAAGDNIGDDPGLLGVGIAANAVVFLVEIAIVALLYKLLEPVNKNLSLMAAYTSKSCSNCGAIFEGLRLAHRGVACECGLRIDRDHHAALNGFKRAGRVREPERSGLPQAWLRSPRL